MTDPAVIEIPAFVTVRPPAPDLPVLARLLADLLAAAAELPQPVSASLSPLSREIELQFPGKPSAFDAMAAWAARFGGTVTAEHREYDDSPQIRAEVRFPHHGAQVKGYAYIPAAKPAAG
ncbi:MAG: hypothetical protein ACLQDY_09210 [Streptosporangiaceae bacterium]